ncbi:MAG: hypothetical protein Q9213_005087 [Squamulea squamosa]
MSIKFMTDVVLPQHNGDETPPQRRKLTLMTRGMLRDKRYTLKRLQCMLSGDYVVVIQKLPPTNADFPETACAYRNCPSFHGKCLPGTYRASIELGVLSGKFYYKPFSAKPSTPSDVVTEFSGGWYCLKCFETIWRCNDADVSKIEALSSPGYKHLAQLENRIYLEDRSKTDNHLSTLNLNKPHKDACQQWLAIHASREIGTNHAENLADFLGHPYVKIYQQQCKEAWGKNLSEVFAGVDELLEAQDAEQRLAVAKTEMREVENVEEVGKKATSFEEGLGMLEDDSEDIIPVLRGEYDEDY